MVVTRLSQTFLLLMFSYASRRLAVRAFTSTVAGGTRRLAVRPVAFQYAQSFSSVTEIGASVEEDLDVALNDILGDTFAEAQSNGVDTGTHMKGSHPIPKALVEEVSNVNCMFCM